MLLFFQIQWIKAFVERTRTRSNRLGVVSSLKWKEDTKRNPVFATGKKWYQTYARYADRVLQSCVCFRFVLHMILSRAMKAGGGVEKRTSIIPNRVYSCMFLDGFNINRFALSRFTELFRHFPWLSLIAIHSLILKKKLNRWRKLSEACENAKNLIWDEKRVLLVACRVMGFHNESTNNNHFIRLVFTTTNARINLAEC